MLKPRCIALIVALLWGLDIALAAAQAPAKGTPTDIAVESPAERSIALAKTGHCKDAFLALNQAKPGLKNNDLGRRAGFAGVRCAMFSDQPDVAENFLGFLNRQFPHNPEVLYLTVHTYSDLSSRAAADLARTAPTSPQAHELHAETYESQGKWDEAAKEYRAVLREDPQMAGIHFRLGRLLLSDSNPPPAAVEEARHEFEQELQIDPSNAGAEYVLGELSRQSQQWDDAIAHFSRASKLDPRFGEAYLGLGISLMSLKRYADALGPLETAVKLDPQNPDAHYNLATAYTRAGRKQDAEKEFAIHQKLIGTQGGRADQPAAAAQEEKK